MIFKKLTNFKLNAFYPYVPELNNSVETGGELNAIFDWFDAKVPGSIHHDLLMASIIRNPYFEMQSMESEWVKDRWWMYKTSFTVGEELKGRNLRLRLAGIDYKAHISLNEKSVGSHEGMYVPFVKNITDDIKFGTQNSLNVVLESAPDEMGQIGYTERTFTQKARFTYKWDWCPRLVQLGLYDDVLIEHFGDVAINYSYIQPVFENNHWKLDSSFETEAFADTEVSLNINLTYNGKVITSTKKNYTLTKGINTLSSIFDVDNPELWFPNGHGNQPLYTLHVEIQDKNGLSDSCTHNVGFRTLSYVQCENAAEGSLPYNVVLNGKRIYLKGVNLTPLDVMYGAIDDNYYQKTLELIKDGNINLIRVWGGGLIEKKVFYDLCDHLGVMVWQEFIQSSSGINNVPSKNPEFLKLAAATATEATKVKRNHVSLTYWSGGNELMDANGVPATFEDENLHMLKHIADTYDKDRLMLPTSASGPNEFLSIDKPKQNHDVHGSWKYLGVEEQYRAFNLSDSQLHSEFGVDGAANYECLCTFTTPNNRYAEPMSKNIVLRHHGEWWDTYDRDSAIFGKFEKQQIHEFIKCSQFIQAEGIRYAAEANRRRMFENCGNMIWQFNEPWPNASGTNVLDYYLKPKLAYYFLRDAYRQTTPSMKYNKLIYDNGENFSGTIFVTNDADEYTEVLKCVVKDDEGEILFKQEFAITVGYNTCTKVAEIEFYVPSTSGFTVNLQLVNKLVTSDYLLLTKNELGYAEKNRVCAYYDKYLINSSN